MYISLIFSMYICVYKLCCTYVCINYVVHYTDSKFITSSHILCGTNYIYMTIIFMWYQELMQLAAESIVSVRPHHMYSHIVVYAYHTGWMDTTYRCCQSEKV